MTIANQIKLNQWLTKSANCLWRVFCRQWGGRKITSRAEITATSLTNEYHFGDFKGDPAKLMEQYFDAHLYFANWGSRTTPDDPAIVAAIEQALKAPRSKPKTR